MPDAQTQPFLAVEWLVEAFKASAETLAGFQVKTLATSDESGQVIVIFRLTR